MDKSTIISLYKRIMYTQPMYILQIIITLCWTIFLVYWALQWKNTKQTQITAWKAGNTRWFVIIVFGGYILLKLFGFRLPLTLLGIQLSDPTIFIQLIGVIITIIGLIVAIIARNTLAKNWSSNIELKKDHTLITSGIYHYMRHPIYTGILLMSVGTIITFETVASILLFIYLTVFFLFKIMKEEQLMLQSFPKEYPTYKNKVKALIPFIV